jgi:molecular chaperone GrpE (heat shock protein)
MNKTHNSSQRTQAAKDPISDEVKKRIIEKMKQDSKQKSNITNKSNSNDFSKRIESLRKETQSKSDFNPNLDYTKKYSQNETSQASSNSKITELENEIEKLQQDLENARNGHIKALADFQNAQKQHDIDLASAKKSTKKGVATTMATFVNTFNLAFSYIPNITDEKIQKFINTLKESFDKSINDIKVHNIEFLIPKTGDIFDPNFMEILNPDSVQGEEVQVKQVVSVGIKVDNQLIQAASIMV